MAIMKKRLMLRRLCQFTEMPRNEVLDGNLTMIHKSGSSIIFLYRAFISWCIKKEDTMQY